MHVLADTWAHRNFAGTPSLVINNTTGYFVVVYLYAAGLIYSACIRIAGAFRKTEIVYIQ